MIKKISMLLVVSLMLVNFSGCSNTKDEVKAKKEILIYCGITMRKPITEIAKILEKELNCKINITQGGSRDLYKALKYSKKGDIYFPGSKSYRTKNLKDGFLKDAVFVGYNKAALMVPKGNPKKLTNDLNQLKDKELKVVICNPESGSIGKETKKILDKKGIYEEVADNSLYLTTDSRNLTKAIKENKADIIINWYAVSKFAKNSNYMDAIEIDEKYAKKKELVLNLLSFSKHPDIARKFMDYASSPKGREIFKKYGFLTDDDMVKLASK